MASLVLVGLPGSGKSSVGQAVADRTGLAFFDTDVLLCEITGLSAPDLIRTRGEASFRDQELAALESVLDKDAVIATGGGIVVNERARQLLKVARTIWLDCDDQSLVERVEEGDRPLLQGDPKVALGRLREKRSSWYQEVSLARVDSSGKLEDVVERVLLEAGRLH